MRKQTALWQDTGLTGAAGAFLCEGPDDWRGKIPYAQSCDPLWVMDMRYIRTAPSPPVYDRYI